MFTSSTCPLRTRQGKDNVRTTVTVSAKNNPEETPRETFQDDRHIADGRCTCRYQQYRACLGRQGLPAQARRNLATELPDLRRRHQEPRQNGRNHVKRPSKDQHRLGQQAQVAFWHLRHGESRPVRHGPLRFLLLERQGSEHPLLHDHALRHDRPRAVRLVLLRWRHGAHAEGLRQAQHALVPRGQHQQPDGRLVPQGDQLAGGPQGSEDADSGICRRGAGKARRKPDQHPAGRALHRARA